MNEDRKVFYVDVGDIPTEKIAAYIQKFTSEFKSARDAKLSALELAANTLSGIEPLV